MWRLRFKEGSVARCGRGVSPVRGVSGAWMPSLGFGQTRRLPEGRHGVVRPSRAGAIWSCSTAAFSLPEPPLSRRMSKLREAKATLPRRRT